MPRPEDHVFFSEVAGSPVLSAKLDLVIRGGEPPNVTVYAVDTKGLHAKSTIERARKELDAFADERRAQVGVGMDRTEQPLSMAMERVEDTLRLDSRAGLARLSGDTGGFLVEGSNDLSGAFRRIDEDNQFHYLLTYAPTNDTPDGRFRAIRVKVGRPGTQVFARKGYRALHARPSTDPIGYESAALALLGRAPLPNAFPIEAAGFSFPDPARPGLSPILVHVSTASLRFDVDRARSSYAGQADIVVRLRDGEGHDVQTLSRNTSDRGRADLERRGTEHPLLPRTGSRLASTDGDDRLRRGRAPGQRPRLHAHGSLRGGRRPRHEQPGPGRSGRGSAGSDAGRRRWRPICRTHAALSEPRRADQEIRVE